MLHTLKENNQIYSSSVHENGMSTLKVGGKKTLIYAKISPKTVNPRDVAGERRKKKFNLSVHLVILDTLTSLSLESVIKVVFVSVWSEWPRLTPFQQQRFMYTHMYVLGNTDVHVLETESEYTFG